MNLPQLLGMQGDFNEWSVVFRGLPQGLWAWLLWIGLAVVLWAAWRNLDRIPGRRQRVALYLLRIAGALLLVMMVLQPAIELRKVLWRKTHVAVLVDDSRSMSLKTGGDISRSAAVQAWFEDHADQFAALSEKYFVDVFSFSETVAKTSLQSIEKGMDAKGRETGMYRALSEMAGRYPPEDLSGIMVVGDGCDTMGFPEGGRRDECPLPTGCDTPIFTFAPYGGGTEADLAITAVRYDDFAFVHNTMSIEVDLRLQGMKAQTLRLSLSREGMPVTAQTVKLEPGKPRTVSLSFKPTKVGRSLYEVSVPVLAGESVKRNNSRMFIVKVIRDKVRVLHVAGRPDWDERFMRRFLKKNPNVDLISFFILRNLEDMFWVPEQELSLIQFPTDELFNTQLHSFDLVIFQNFTYRGFQMEHYLRNIARFVREGGAFMMIGGDFSFNGGNFSLTEIEDVLPVRLAPVGNPFDGEAFSPKLTDAGQKHPILRLDRDREKNLGLWAALPQLQGINTGLLLRDDALLLAQHPSLTEPGTGRPAPLVALRRVQKGRSLIVAADSSWKWNFDQVRRGGGPEFYNRFYSNAIRWLIKDPDLELLQVIPGRDSYRPGEVVTLSIRALDDDFLPAQNTPVTVEWQDASGRVDSSVLRTDEDGAASLTFPAPQVPGPLTIKASGDMGGDTRQTASALVLVDEGGVEFSRVAVCGDKLQDLARHSGGAAYSLTDSVNVQELPLLAVRARRIADREDVPLWDAWWVLVAAAALFGVEWWWRKRRRLP